MTNFVFTNNAKSTLAGALTSSGTSLNVAAGTGVLFPQPAVNQQFAITLLDAATGLLIEIMYCTARVGDTMTVVRAQEGTIALNWNPGDLVSHRFTAGQMNSLTQGGGNTINGFYYGNDTGTPNALNAATTPVPLSIIDGQIYEITPANANTSSGVTLRVNGSSAYPCKRADGTNLLPGDIQPSPAKALFAFASGPQQFMLLNPAVWASAAGNPTIFATATGSPNAVVLSTPTPVLSYTPGQLFEFTPTAANTTSAVSLGVGALPAYPLRRTDGTVLFAGDLQPGPAKALVAADPANFAFLLINPATWISQFNGSLQYLGDTGTSANAMAGTLGQSGVTPTGNVLVVATKNNQANTGPITLAANGGSAIPVTWADGTAFQAGDWEPFRTFLLLANFGSNFAQVLSVPGNASPTQRGVVRQASTVEALNGATTGSTPAFVRPEDMAAAAKISVYDPTKGLNSYGQFVCILVHTASNTTPIAAGFVLGNIYTAAQINSGSFPGVTALGVQGLTGSVGSNFVATNPVVFTNGTGATGTWQLTQTHFAQELNDNTMLFEVEFVKVS